MHTRDGMTFGAQVARGKHEIEDLSALSMDVESLHCIELARSLVMVMML